MPLVNPPIEKADKAIRYFTNDFWGMS